MTGAGEGLGATMAKGLVVALSTDWPSLGAAERVGTGAELLTSAPTRKLG